MTVIQQQTRVGNRDFAQVLLDAKCAVPLVRPGAISRVQLIERARSSGCQIVTVTAPAGYGKSTFLAEWAHLEERRVGWVAFDSLDDDPRRLLSLLACSYNRIDSNAPEDVCETSGPGTSVLGRAAPRLAAAFISCPRPFVLMLDDLHELQSPHCHDVLDLIIRRIPPGSQLVITSRSEQPHVPRLRASDEVLEIGPDDLALDESAALQIFGETQVLLTAEQAKTVVQRTEGWPVGLHLAALIAKGSWEQGATVAGDDPYVADYLYREALSRQPEDVQRFLRRTAVLDELCGALCDAVLGSPGGAEKLRRVEASGLFLIPLDRRREWYRYHALFREFLLGDLRLTEPEDIEALHGRAADWYETFGSPSSALEHLLQTQQRDRSARLITRLASRAWGVGQWSTCLRWLSRLDDASIEGYPPLAFLAGWVAVLTGDAIGAERWAALVDAAAFDAAKQDGGAYFESSQALLRAVMCAHGPEQMRADAEMTFTLEPEWGARSDTATLLFGEARLLAGDFVAAQRFFVEASDTSVMRGGTGDGVMAESELALLAMDRGDWEEASHYLDLALATVEEKRLQDDVTATLVFAGAARRSFHYGHWDEGQAQLARAMRGRPLATHVLPFVAVRLRTELAKVYLAMGDPIAARQLLREIDHILLRRPQLGTLVDQVEALRQTLAGAASRNGTSPLTPAELRLLPYLQTYLTLSAISERLFVSRATVSTQTTSIYRKLGVSSRRAAVEAATACGLLGD